MYLCGQFIGEEISRNTGKQSQIEFHSTCKAKKEPWKRKPSTNHNFFGFDMVFWGVEGNSFRAIQNKIICLCVARPSQQIQATIWASNAITTQMCFVSDTVLIPFTFDYYVLKSCKWSISYCLSNIQNKPWNDIPRVILIGFYIQILTMAIGSIIIHYIRKITRVNWSLLSLILTVSPAQTLENQWIMMVNF